jgi:hypothetical protein
METTATHVILILHVTHATGQCVPRVILAFLEFAVTGLRLKQTGSHVEPAIKKITVSDVTSIRNRYTTEDSGSTPTALQFPEEKPAVLAIAGYVISKHGVLSVTINIDEDFYLSIGYTLYGLINIRI